MFNSAYIWLGIVTACAAYCDVCDTEGVGKCDADTATVRGCQTEFVWDHSTKMCTGSMYMHFIHHTIYLSHSLWQNVVVTFWSSQLLSIFIMIISIYANDTISH